MTTTAIDYNDRRQYLGGSDAPAVLGVSRYRTPYTVWATKRGELVEEELEPDDARARRMRLGVELEKYVLGEWVRDHGVLSLDRRHPLAVDRRHPRRAGHLDARARLADGRRAVVDAKVVGAFRRQEFGEPGTDEVPADEAIQMAHYLSLVGEEYEVAVLAVLFSGARDPGPFPFLVPRNRRLGEDLVELELDMANRVWGDGPPPPVDGSDAATAALSRQYAHSSAGVVVPETPELRALAAILYDRRKALRAAGAASSEVENQIKAMMGTGEVLEGLGYRITWRSNARGSVGWKNVAAVYRRALDELSGKHGFELPAEIADAEAVEELYRGRPSRPFEPKWDRED